jgi:anti-sigma regulatory factor (Ser/Thr protein kinase)
MKKVVIDCLVIGAIVAAIGVARRTAAARRDTDLNAADVIRVSRRSLVSVVKATWVIKPMVGAQVNVGSTVSGVVSRLQVRIADTVRKGQLLAELDCRELAARREAAEAAWKLAEANLAYSQTDLKRKQALNTERLIAPNVLEKAFKYSLPDSRPVEISTSQNGDDIAVRVSDDGPGISETDGENIFEPFFRVDRSRSKNTGGYGLGLSICKRIMEAHGDGIAVERNPGRGTSFLLTLPKRA